MPNIDDNFPAAKAPDSENHEALTFVGSQPPLSQQAYDDLIAKSFQEAPVVAKPAKPIVADPPMMEVEEDEGDDDEDKGPDPGEPERRRKNPDEVTQDQPKENEDADDLANNWRMSTKDPTEKRAYKLKRENPDWPLEKCLSLAAGKPLFADVQNQTPPVKVEQEQTAPDDGLPKSMEELEAATDAAFAAQKQAIKDYDADAQAEAAETLFKLNKHGRVLQKRLSEQQARSVFEAEQAYDANYAQAEALLPDAFQPGTPANDKLRKLDAKMQQANPQFIHSPERPLILAQTLRELGMTPAPATPAKAVPPKPTPMSTHRELTSNLPPRGTQEQGGNVIKELLAQVTDMDKYNAMFVRH